MTINAMIEAMPWFKKLELLRGAKGWSQEEAAEKCGATKKNYWLWATGKCMPRHNTKKSIASAFGVSPEEIWGPDWKQPAKGKMN